MVLIRSIHSKIVFNDTKKGFSNNFESPFSFDINLKSNSHKKNLK